MTRSKLYRRIFEFILNDEAALNRQTIYRAMYKGNDFRKLLQLVLMNLKLLLTGTGKDKGNLYGGRWVLIGTKNHYDSMRFLRSEPCYKMIRIGGFDKAGAVVPKLLNVQSRYNIFHVLRNGPMYFKWYLQNPVSVKRAFYYLLQDTGVYEYTLNKLKHYRPECIVLSNDHLPVYRALMLAARHAGVPTVYIQHACVSGDFPSLLTDLHLLDGQDALDKYYNGKENYGTPELVGMSKYDTHAKSINTRTVIQSIGVPYNKLIKIDQVVAAVTKLAIAFPKIKIIVRPHPRDERLLPNFTNKNVEVSDAQKEDAFDFLKRLDCIVASCSSIHLEAAMMNVYPMLYSGDNCPAYDNYDFIDNGLVRHYATVEDVIADIELVKDNRPSVRDRAMFYCASLGTDYEGRSGELAIEKINKFLQKNHQLQNTNNSESNH